MISVDIIKKQKDDKFSALFKECKLFFAFTDMQFEENKTPLEDGDKYVSIGGGGVMPKSKIETFLAGSKQINKEFKDAIKQNKVRTAYILDELINHEAFYTASIEDTLESLGTGYTAEEVQIVFNKYKEKYMD